ncbi:MAG: GIY-YIG nuclease family protein [Chromatiaceae bacterium]|nr:GIY-YIG nuclease family protein [Chromatiaceae bacterium]
MGTSSAGWYVYILRCGDGTLYTGTARDPCARLQRHNGGRGAKYTRSRLPVELVFHQLVGSHGDALRREAQIKRLSRQDKQLLIRSVAGCDPVSSADH